MELKYGYYKYGTYMYENPTLSKLCRKNHIRNVVG